MLRTRRGFSASDQIIRHFQGFFFMREQFIYIVKNDFVTISKYLDGQNFPLVRCITRVPKLKKVYIT